MSNIAELSRHRDLVWLWTRREVQVRYKQSVLGMGWAVMQPLALAAIFTVVFSAIVHVDSDGVPYPLFSYTALVPWTFFSTSLSFAIPSLINNMNLVTKTYFPREVLPLASIGAAFVDYVVAAAILIVMVFASGYRPGWVIVWMLPLILLQLAVATAVVLPGAAILVFFRDVRFVVPLLVQIWMYATPVIYPASAVPERFRILYYLNPMAVVVSGYRSVLLHGQRPDGGGLLLGAAVTACLLVCGYVLFKRVEPLFADVI